MQIITGSERRGVVPHAPDGAEHDRCHIVLGEAPHPLTGAMQPRIVFSGTRAECAAFIREHGEA